MKSEQPESKTSAQPLTPIGRTLQVLLVNEIASAEAAGDRRKVAALKAKLVALANQTNPIN